MNWDRRQIRCLRLRLGWSAAELGRRLGCNAELVMRWEDGDAEPDGDAVNHMRHLSAYVEQNSIRVSQIPLAEEMMAREHLAQITHDMVARLHKD